MKMTNEKQPPAKPAPIPDDAPKDWPLTPKEAGDGSPANRQAYEDAAREDGILGFGESREEPEEPEKRE
jgi:hypothetical protein